MNGYPDVPLGAVHRGWHANSGSSMFSNSGEMKMDSIVKSQGCSHVLDVQPVTRFVRLQFRVPNG